MLKSHFVTCKVNKHIDSVVKEIEDQRNELSSFLGLDKNLLFNVPCFVTDFFNTADSMYYPVNAKLKMHYPIDVYDDNTGLNINIVVLDAKKEDINISIESDVLKVSYEKQKEEKTTDDNIENKKTYYLKNISNRSFNVGWKILTKYDLSNISADIDNGVLKVYIPYKEEQLPKKIEIKSSK